MSGKWTTTALGKSEGADKEISEESLNEQVVILLQGRNVFGDPIYSYLQLTLRNLYELKARMDSGNNFNPSDHGTVIAAGKGEPSEELRSEMAVQYQLVDIPQRAVKPAQTHQPRFWGDEEEDS